VAFIQNVTDCAASTSPEATFDATVGATGSGLTLTETFDDSATSDPETLKTSTRTEKLPVECGIQM
jgi:hypothetical protein